jgi:hypothetical protein
MASYILSILKLLLPHDKIFTDTPTNILQTGGCKIYLTTTIVCKDSY